MAWIVIGCLWNFIWSQKYIGSYWNLKYDSHDAKRESVGQKQFNFIDSSSVSRVLKNFNFILNWPIIKFTLSLSRFKKNHVKKFKSYRPLKFQIPMKYCKHLNWIFKKKNSSRRRGVYNINYMLCYALFKIILIFYFLE